jgi:hypothetical protein
MRRRILQIVACGLLFLASGSDAWSQADPALYSAGDLSYRCSDAFYANGQRVVGYSVLITVPRWRELTDDDFRKQVANAAFGELKKRCLAQGQRAAWAGIFFLSTGHTESGIIVSNGQIVLNGWISATDQTWHFSDDKIAAAAAYEDAGIQSVHEGQERQRQADAQRKAEEEAKQARRTAALADCGATLQISGGPWFSSTYKTAATDASHNERFLCVKTVEYIGAAVNPFGGNAARAKFTGYDAFNYQRLDVVMDFPY